GRPQGRTGAGGRKAGQARAAARPDRRGRPQGRTGAGGRKAGQARTRTSWLSDSASAAKKPKERYRLTLRKPARAGKLPDKYPLGQRSYLKKLLGKECAYRIAPDPPKKRKPGT
ncbi:MAG: hypothetical protein OXI87_15865, partial [Albidovulum sp.]|nr:hypothetical protein [Albidovulum sp.]